MGCETDIMAPDTPQTATLGAYSRAARAHRPARGHRGQWYTHAQHETRHNQWMIKARFCLALRKIDTRALTLDTQPWTIKQRLFKMFT
jgi:hypothetical protein